jgi:hypothetical protein
VNYLGSAARHAPNHAFGFDRDRLPEQFRRFF